MKKKLTKLTLTLVGGLLACSALVACNEEQEDPAPEVEEKTAGQNLVNYVTSNGLFELTGVAYLSYDSHEIELSLDAQAKAYYLNEVGIGGDANFIIDGESLETTITYFNDEVTLHAFNNYIKTRAINIERFIALVQAGLRDGASESKLAFLNPTISSKSGISWTDLFNQIASLTHDDLRQYSEDGTYYYPINISGIEVGIKTDLNDTFLGARLNHVNIGATTIYADVDCAPISEDQFTLVNPLEQEDADKYIEFEYAFNLWDAIKSLVSKDQITASISVDAKNINGDTLEDLFSLKCDAGLNYDSQELVLDAELTKGEKTYSFLGEYVDDTVYVNVNSLAICMKTGTITDIINYASGVSNESSLPKLLNSVSVIMGSSELATLIAQLKSAIGTIVLQEDFLSVDLDLSAFDEKLGSVSVSMSFDETGVKNITIPSFKYDNYQFDNVVIEFKDFELPTINKEEYQSLDHAISYAQAIESLFGNTKFSLEVNATMETRSGIQEAALTSNVELNLDDQFAFGNLTIVDGEGYAHKLDADVDFDGDILFTYNDKLNGKFDITTLFDVKDMDLGETETGESLSVFQTILNSITTLVGGVNNPIVNAITNRDYLALLDYDVVRNLRTAADKIYFELDPIVLGNGERQVGIELNFTGSDKVEVSSIKVTDLPAEGSYLDIEVKLNTYDSAKEAKRLVDDGSFLDFTSLKTLIEFGISTTQFTYYKFDGHLRAYILGETFRETIPFVGTIKIVDGTLLFEIQFNSVPIVLGINPGFSNNGLDEVFGADTRNSHIYYDGEYFYSNRYDHFGFGNSTYYTRKSDSTFFFNNIGYILMQDVLWINGDHIEDWGIPYPTYTDTNEAAKSSSSLSTGISYESILRDYSYSQSEGTDNFKFVIDANALIGSNTFDDDVEVNVAANSETNVLTTVDATTSLDIDVDNTIEFHFNLNTTKMGTDADTLEGFEEFKESDLWEPTNSHILNHYYRRCDGDWQDRTADYGE